MPITPNAPDYVSQVRAVLNATDEYNLRNRQLALQEQQAAATLRLQSAQLAAQRENQAREYDLALAQNETALAKAQQESQQDYLTRLRQAQQDDLAERKFGFEQQKEINDLMQKRAEAEQEETSGYLENAFRAAYESGDPQKISDVTAKIAAANLKTAQRTAIYDNVYGGIQKKRELEQNENNLRTASQARSIADRLNALDPRLLTPNRYAIEVENLESEFRGLNNTDPRINDAFTRIRTSTDNKFAAYRDSVIGREVNSFIDLAEQNTRLEPEYQKEYDALKARPEGVTTKAVQGLAFRRNKAESLARLQRIDQENVALINEAAKNPQIVASGVDLGRLLPDLTPDVGFDGNIDPDTGLLTKSFLESQKRFEDDIRRPSFILGQQPTFQQAIGQTILPRLTAPPAGTQVQAPAKPAGSVVVGRPIQSRSRFDVAQPGTVTIPTAPQAAPRLSPEDVNKILAQATTNPDAIFPGTKLTGRQMVERLRQGGYLENQPGTTNVAAPGQTR